MSVLESTDRQIHGETGRNRPRFGLHIISVIVLVVGLVVTGALAFSSWSTSRSSQNQLLALQAQGAASAVQSTINSIQSPMLAADHLAATVGGVAAFRNFMSTEVGSGAPFRSVSLWMQNGSTVQRLVNVGSEPVQLDGTTPLAARIALLTADQRLQIVGLATHGTRIIGFAMADPILPRHLVIYAEATLPRDGVVQFPPSSPYYGLNFALYLGTLVQPSSLIESTVRGRLTGLTKTQILAFGDHQATVISALSGASAPSLLRGEPLLILLIGSLLSCASAIGVEALVTRRIRAESSASQTDERFHAERVVSQALQRALVPELRPSFPGLEIATQYSPGTEGLDVGGDWYDVVAVDAQHLLLSVGDVSGRGVKAATVMGALRQAIRAYAKQGSDPVEILGALDRLIAVEQYQCFATVLLVKFDVPGHQLTLASAGHLPPLLMGQHTARFIELEVSPPVGVSGSERLNNVTVQVQRGARVLAYTDGLIERRGESIDDGLERLRLAATGDIASLDAFVDQIVSEFTIHDSSDDIAVVGVGWLDRDDNHSWSQLFPGLPDSIRDCRVFVRDACSSISVKNADVAVLLSSELATNAVRHAGSSYRVRVFTDGSLDHVRVEVTDWGPGDPQPKAPSHDEIGGRGLQIVEALAARWGSSTNHAPDTTTVWFELE